MQAKTLDYIGRRTYPANLSAHIAFRAIMRAVGRTKLPKAYLCDLAIDADILYLNSPKRFVFVLHDSGTHLWYEPNPTLSLAGILSSTGKDAHFFAYDEDRLSPGRDEPDLMEVSAEAMWNFLQLIGNERTEKRYLTAAECTAISDDIERKSGEETPLSMYIRDTHLLPPANGACLEVALTKNEARLVDNACRNLGISCD